MELEILEVTLKYSKIFESHSILDSKRFLFYLSLLKWRRHASF